MPVQLLAFGAGSGSANEEEPRHACEKKVTGSGSRDAGAGAVARAARAVEPAACADAERRRGKHECEPKHGLRAPRERCDGDAREFSDTERSCGATYSVV